MTNMPETYRSFVSIVLIALLTSHQVLPVTAQRSSSTLVSSSRSAVPNPFSVRPASSSAAASAAASASVCRCPSSPLSSALAVSASRCPSASVFTSTVTATATATVTVTATTTDSTSCAKGRELVVNGGFESGLQGYTTSTSGSGVAVSASCGQGPNFAYVGNCGGLFTIAAGSTSSSGSLKQTVNNFCPNFKYIVSFYYKITTGCTLELKIVQASSGILSSTGSPSQWAGSAFSLQANAQPSPGSNFISYPMEFIARSTDASRSCGISIDRFSITADQPV